MVAALNFQTTDRLPRDLDGMGSSSISAFAYPALVRALGLPPRRPKIFDTSQMLALVDRDVLDALGCDCVTVQGEFCSNAFEESELWHDYDFNGRLPARVMYPESFHTQPDDGIRQFVWGEWQTMTPDGHVFSLEHGGQEVDWFGEPRRPDPGSIPTGGFRASQLERMEYLCFRARRESGDRAVVFSGLNTGMGFWGGMANFSILALQEPELIHTYHEALLEQALIKVEQLLPRIRDSVDVLHVASDDQGTQQSTILPPEVYRELFTPYYRRFNAAIHRLAPEVKTFYHSCGAIYPLLGAIADGGFDVLNPVQWTAGTADAAAWREATRGKVALWGGGVDTQHVMPSGSVADVAGQARSTAAVLSQGSGYVFCAIHNLLAETAPEKIIAMYESV